MTTPREALGAAIADRAEARSALTHVEAAISHAENELRQLEDKKAALDEVERKRSEGLAARVVAAMKSGAAAPIGGADAGAKQRRLDRMEIEDNITTAMAVVEDLRGQRTEASACAEATQKAFETAQHAVLRVDALALAERLVAVRVEAGTLHRRLRMYQSTLPLEGQDLARHRPGIRFAPAEVVRAMADDLAGAATNFDFLPGGALRPEFKVELDAWFEYMTALDADADAAPQFPLKG